MDFKDIFREIQKILESGRATPPDPLHGSASRRQIIEFESDFPDHDPDPFDEFPEPPPPKPRAAADPFGTGWDSDLAVPPPKAGIPSPSELYDEDWMNDEDHDDPGDRPSPVAAAPAPAPPAAAPPSPPPEERPKPSWPERTPTHILVTGPGFERYRVEIPNGKNPAAALLASRARQRDLRNRRERDNRDVPAGAPPVPPPAAAPAVAPPNVFDDPGGPPDYSDPPKKDPGKTESAPIIPESGNNTE
ncbi:MAG: hypothetical protein LBF41_02515, partial [Deltaproteobacteria bacterium]|nr:hypothetical protein [Deltaproteobacteria bacterium]